jgi:hypothetical protein
MLNRARLKIYAPRFELKRMEALRHAEPGANVSVCVPQILEQSVRFRPILAVHRVNSNVGAGRLKPLAHPGN